MNTILITGANRGLGLGFSRHYLAAGHRVFAAARDPGGSADLMALQGEYGDWLNVLRLDVSSEESVLELADSLEGLALDLVINNAGVCRGEAFGQWTAATFVTAMAVNVTGAALVAQAVAPSMKRGAKLVNISSGLGSIGLNLSPDAGLDAYAASKAALNLVSCRLASILEADGITVLAMSPGWVQTRMGGEKADLTVDESIAAMSATIERLTRADSGRFVDRHGDPIPW